MITTRQKSGLAVAAAAFACLLAGPSTASAAGVDCWGHLIPAAKHQRDLTYEITCADNVKAFSIVSNIEVGAFSTTADVLDPSTRQPVDGQSFNCEGPIPGDGFGCNGVGQGPNIFTGTFSIDGPRCVKRRNRLRAWVVAEDMNGSTAGPVSLAVPPRCSNATSKKGRRR